MMSFKQAWGTRGAASRLRSSSTLVACLIALATLLGTPRAWAALPLNPGQVIINAEGGANANDGLRIYLGNLGGIQVVRENATQYYGDTPLGPQGVNNGFFMAVGPEGAATVYGPQLNIQWVATAWTAISQTDVTGEGTAEDPYQVVTIMSAGGIRLAQTVRYVVPKVYFDVRLTVVPPPNNDRNLRVYHWLDTYLNSGDYGPAFWQPDVGDPTVVGVAKGGQYELLIQGSRAWDAYFSARYVLAGQQMKLGGSLLNTLATAADTDNGIAAQWDIGTPTTPVTWTYRLATVQINTATCGDGEVAGYEGCDDDDTDDNDGCSSICQIEVGYACIGAPSSCEECFEDIDCDDGDDCTIDTCSDNACDHTGAPEGTACLTGVCDEGGLCLECLEDADCGKNGPFCNLETNTCYCEEDGDCDDDNECTGAECSEGLCEYPVYPSTTECSIGHCNGKPLAPLCVCATDADCNDQNSCSVEACESGECLYVYTDGGDPCETGYCTEDEVPVCLQCYEDEHCPDDEPWCKLEIDECVACLEDDHCDDQNECTRDRCGNDVCSNELRVGHRCEEGGYCSDEEPVCVECVTFSNCPDEQPQCLDHECVECLTNADCTDPAKPHCKGSTNQCEGCATNADCDDGNDCTTDTCGAQACAHTAVTPGTACEGGYCAGTDTPACVTCADTEDGALDEGCSEALPVCVTEGNGSSCVLCEAGDGASNFGCEGETPFCNDTASPRTCIACRTTDDCADGEACSTAGDCEARCEADDDCLDATAPHCVVATGECVECSSDEDCQGDDVCSGAGRCGGVDTDVDGLPDGDDLDDDDDGIADALEAAEDDDSDGDGLPNAVDRDSDGDGIADVVESGGADSNADGVWDDSVDANANGIADAREGDIELPDSDADGTPDFRDTDADDDGIDDAVEASDADYDGAADQPASGNDDDNDGLDAAFDSSEGGSAVSLPDQDGDQVPDYQDAEGAVVIPSDGGTTPTEITDEDSGVSPGPTNETTVQPGADAAPPAETEEPTTEEPTESEPGTSDTEDTETATEPTATTDAGTPTQTTPDAIVDAGADAGTDAGAGDDGCGCRVVGAQSTQGTPSALWLLALTGLLLQRRSRSSSTRV